LKGIVVVSRKYNLKKEKNPSIIKQSKKIKEKKKL